MELEVLLGRPTLTINAYLDTIVPPGTKGRTNITFDMLPVHKLDFYSNEFDTMKKPV